ncbi:unnamed protein product [Dibothriocephalus latus]|uniref:Uncharacterized protein n=1 Tax=Dibothriocephalus latus TaxID=60516 RepID=A0A3P7LYX9_DIBLA|nr:unnamed protein product [Dibothriocephalus latus]
MSADSDTRKSSEPTSSLSLIDEHVTSALDQPETNDRRCSDSCKSRTLPPSIMLCADEAADRDVVKSSMTLPGVRIRERQHIMTMCPEMGTSNLRFIHHSEIKGADVCLSNNIFVTQSNPSYCDAFFSFTFSYSIP